jgi:hypothetical protein
MTLGGTAAIDVGGAAAGDAAGSVLLFSEGSAFLEAGLRIDASSVAGNGGFIFIEAEAEDAGFDPTSAGVTLVTPSIRARGQLLTEGGGAAAAGVTWLSGATVEVAGNLSTGGGNLMIAGDEGVVVRPDVSIDSTNAAPGGAAGWSHSSRARSPKRRAGTSMSRTTRP